MFEESARKKNSSYRYVSSSSLTSGNSEVSNPDGWATTSGSVNLPNVAMQDDCIPPVNYKLTSSGSSKKVVVARLPEGNVPAYRAVFLVSNAALGAGLLNFPEAYHNAGGIVNAFSVQIVLLFFIIGAFLILARCANKSQSSTYQDVVLFMCGSKLRRLCEVLIIVYFFGSCVTYNVIIGEQMTKVMQFAFNTDKEPWYCEHRFLMSVVSTVFILPLCIPKRLQVLSYSSLMGAFGALFITFVIAYKYLSGSYAASSVAPSRPLKEGANAWAAPLSAIPVICFGFQCHVSSVAVYADLKNRSLFRFFSVTVAAMIVCTVVYTLCGCFGYLTFGSNTDHDILYNYNKSDVLANIARVMVVLIIFSSFAIITFCARTAIDGMIVAWRNLGPDEAEMWERFRRIIETLVWFLLALLLAAVTPNISDAISVIGGIAALFIFVFPGLCLIQSVVHSMNILRRHDIFMIVIGVVYITVGVFIFGQSTVHAIYKFAGASK